MRKQNASKMQAKCSITARPTMEAERDLQPTCAVLPPQSPHHHHHHSLSTFHSHLVRTSKLSASALVMYYDYDRSSTIGVLDYSTGLHYYYFICFALPRLAKKEENRVAATAALAPRSAIADHTRPVHTVILKLVTPTLLPNHQNSF